MSKGREAPEEQGDDGAPTPKAAILLTGLAGLLGILLTVLATGFSGGSLLAYQRQATALESIADTLAKPAVSFQAAPASDELWTVQDRGAGLWRIELGPTCRAVWVDPDSESNPGAFLIACVTDVNL